MKGRNRGFYRKVASLARDARRLGFGWTLADFRDGTFFGWLDPLEEGAVRACPLRFARMEMRAWASFSRLYYGQ